MGERRSFPRYAVDKQLKGRYFIDGVDRKWEECSILNVSHIGFCVRFQTKEAIDLGTTINLEIEIPEESTPLSYPHLYFTNDKCLLEALKPKNFMMLMIATGPQVFAFAGWER